MRTEAPVLQRCCVCLPLRFGLMAWAFYHLIIDVVLLSFAFITVYEMVVVYYYIPEPQLGVLCIFTAVLLIDIALNTTFIVGAHKREVHLLKIYFIYNVVLWVLATLLAMFLIGFTIHAMAVIGSSLFGYLFIVILGSIALSMLIYIVIQTYFLLLIRSEIIKLHNNSNFQFVNNAAEAEATCTLYMEYMDYVSSHNDIENNPTIVNNEMQDEHDVETCEKDNGTCGSKSCCKVELNGERLT